MRYDIEDFGDHISYGYYTKDVNGISLGEEWIKAPELTETIIIGGYVYTWSQFYRNSSASDSRLHRIFKDDIHRLSIFYTIASEDNKYWVAFAMVKFIKSVSKYGILLDSNQINFIKWKGIKVRDGKTVYDLIIDYYKEYGYPIVGNISSCDLLNEDDIKMALENHKVFEPKDGTYIPYAMLYKPSSDHHLINEHCSEALFSYCIDRADISMIMTDGNKNIWKCFVKEVAMKYEHSDDYKKMAAKSLGIDDPSKLGAIGNAYAKYDEYFGKVLPRTDQRKKKQKY